MMEYAIKNLLEQISEKDAEIENLQARCEKFEAVHEELVEALAEALLARLAPRTVDRGAKEEDQ